MFLIECVLVKKLPLTINLNSLYNGQINGVQTLRLPTDLIWYFPPPVTTENHEQW